MIRHTLFALAEYAREAFALACLFGFSGSLLVLLDALSRSLS